MVYKFQKYTSLVRSCVDSDHAGCLRTRKSTNGGALMLGQHCLKSWSSTQSVIALSSGEAEFYALVKGASSLLGMISVGSDLNIPMSGQLWSDSSAAIGIASRRGLGKVKHLHTQYLWIQERVKNKEFTLHKERTDRNVGDLFTKYLDRPKLDKFTSMCGFVVPRSASQLGLKSAG